MSLVFLAMSKVYISYRWQEPIEGIVRNWLCGVLDKAGIEYVIDVKDCKYRNSIGRFEQEIGAGDNVIIVVSNAYLHSVQCMYEAALITESGDLEKRVFPIQIGDYSHNDSYYLKLCEDWKKILDEVEYSLDMVLEEQREPIEKKLDQIVLIQQKIGEFWSYLSDVNFATFSEVSKNDFEAILNFLKVEKSAPLWPIEMAE